MENFNQLKSVTVLYVEDSKFLAKATNRVIEGYFNKIYIASNGQEALDLLQEHKNEIDIIITDLIMPVLDGIEMLEIVRKNGSSIPAIITTGYDDALTLDKLIDLSIDGFLSKPIDPIKLLQRVNKVIDSLFIKRELAIKKEMIDKDIIYSETDEKGFITYVSKPFEKISGYTKDELIGKTHSILKDKNSNETLYNDMWNTLKSSKQWHGEITNRRKNGSSYTINAIMSPIYFREKLIGYSATSIDITELKNKSKELQAKSKLASMGEMVSMIAHQWRQPIASIGMITNNLHLDLMMDELKKDTLEDSIYNIDQHVKYLSKTIDIFRGFLKDTKPKEVFTMKESINEALLAIQEGAKEKNIVINIENRCAKFEMNTFKDGLIQAMINILTNSKEALIRKNIALPKIDIFCYEDENYIYIKISDNAGGIEDEILPNIFTPYFSTKTNKNGSGLGLYMTKTIVEDALDGTLHIQNIKDGVEFTIGLLK